MNMEVEAVLEVGVNAGPAEKHELSTAHETKPTRQHSRVPVVGETASLLLTLTWKGYSLMRSAVCTKSIRNNRETEREKREVTGRN